MKRSEALAAVLAQAVLPPADGINGKAGATGATGGTGPRGDRGPKGDTGPEGPEGPIGPEGPRGIQGERGPRGLRGPAGKDGQSVWSRGGSGGGGGTGTGLPTGGTIGQTLVKQSSTTGDALWGPLGLLPDPGNVWAAGTYALGHRISVPGTNLSFLVWEVTTAGTTGGTIPNFEAVPLNSAPITDGTVVWTFQGYVGKVLGAKSIEADRASDGSTGSSVILEDAVVGQAGDIYIRGGHGIIGNPGGKVGIQSGFGDGGALARAYIEVTAGDPTVPSVGGTISAYAAPSSGGHIGASMQLNGGDDSGPRGGPGYLFGGNSAAGNERAAVAAFGGNDDDNAGGSVILDGGDGIVGARGGSMELSGGKGNGGASTEAALLLQGGLADGTPGRILITSDAVTGDLADVLTAQGDGTAIWVPGATGLTAGTYTITNDSTLRTLNVASFTPTQLANFVATLVRDLGGT